MSNLTDNKEMIPPGVGHLAGNFEGQLKVYRNVARQAKEGDEQFVEMLNKWKPDYPEWLEAMEKSAARVSKLPEPKENTPTDTNLKDDNHEHVVEQGRGAKVSRLPVYSNKPTRVSWLKTLNYNAAKTENLDTRLLPDVACLQIGETSLLYGASGSGKSTLSRIFCSKHLEGKNNLVVVFTENYTTIDRDMSHITPHEDRFYKVNISRIKSAKDIEEVLKELYHICNSRLGKDGIVLVVVDTLTKLLGSGGHDSNKKTEMAHLLNPFTLFLDSCPDKNIKACVAILYHTKKNDARTYSGSPAIYAMCNSRHLITKNAKNRTTTIETDSGQAIDSGYTQRFKMLDLKKVKQDFNMFTNYKLVPESEESTDTKDVDKSKAYDLRRAFAALCFGSVNGVSQAKNVTTYAGFSTRKVSGLLQQLSDDGYINATKRPIKVNNLPEETSLESIQMLLDNFSNSYDLSPLSIDKLGMRNIPDRLK